MDKLMLLDGNSLINRAFYGIRLLTTKDGIHTNAVYGFINMLSKYMEDIQPTHILVAFDVAAPTFRHHEYTEYKSTRSGMPPELKQQLPLLKEVLAAMNIQMLEREGYEADDIIGTVARLCNEQGADCHIVTGDRDDLQLISEHTFVHLIVTRKHETFTDVWDMDAMQREYGVTPRQFVDVKALMGDKSDNIPGVPGIGQVRACNLIATFGSIDELYEHLDSPLISPAHKVNLQENRGVAFQSRRLCAIDCKVPIEFQLEQHAITEWDYGKLREIYKRLEFKKLLKKMDEGGHGSDEVFVDGDYHIISDPAELTAVAEQLLKAEGIFFYFHPLNDSEQAVGFSADGETCWCACPGSRLDYQQILTILTPVFAAEHIEKTSINLSQLMVYLHSCGVSIAGRLFDVSIGAYLLKPSAYQYPVEELYEDYTGIPPLADIDQFGLEQDAYRCLRMVRCLKPIRDYEETHIAEEGQTELFRGIEMPLVPILASMQIEGFRIDRQHLEAFRDDAQKKLEVVQEEIFELAGERFNLSSTRKMGAILFEKLGLYSAKKSKTGYSTSAESLEKIRNDHPIIEKIIYYRKLSKLKSTYADGLLGLINPDTGKIHSKFNQTVAVTGRISSQDPNMQSIPVRQELGRELRRVFIARSEEYTLVSADYSQIELRVLAHLCGDETMVDAFNNNGDIHAKTAAFIFHVPPEEVTKDMRTRAKAVNFGVIYGMGDYGLANDLHISRKEAKAYISDYFANHPRVDQYMKDTIEAARRDGYVTTMFHRKRYIPELSSNNYALRNFGSRAAMNAPIQGTAADIIKMAMIRVYDRLKGMKSRLILQVHDELIVDTHRSELEQVKEILKEEMEHVCKLNVPLEVDVNEGKTWLDTK